MRAQLKFVLSVSAAALALSVTADAHPHGRKKSWNPVGECYESVEGLAASTGILGLGTARAREAARSDWESKVANKYGPAFANLDRARNTQWDCKKNALVLAKCVVVATPCASRISG